MNDDRFGISDTNQSPRNELESQRDLDALIRRMQTAEAASAVDKFFSMSPEELGAAAHAAALRRAHDTGS